MLDGNSAAELAHDLASMRAPKPERWLETARDELIDRLVRGDAVHQRTRDDIFAAALEEPDEITHGHLLDLLRGALHLDTVFGDDLVLAMAEVRDNAVRFVERYVDAHPDWIFERAVERAAEARACADEE